MEKSDKKESVNENLFYLRKGLHELKNDSNKEDIEDLQKYIKNLVILFRGVKRLILILFIGIVILIGILIANLSYKSEVKTFNQEINDLKDDSLVRKILNIKEIKNGDSIITKYRYFLRENKVITYENLSKENDSLESVIQSKTQAISKLTNEKERIDERLEFVLETYKIRLYEKDNLINIESKQLDSALILLDAFRHKMSYDKATDKWTITH